MRRKLACLLRKLADRLDPAPMRLVTKVRRWRPEEIERWKWIVWEMRRRHIIPDPGTVASQPNDVEREIP